jgi:hypothetical protein
MKCSREGANYFGLSIGKWRVTLLNAKDLDEFELLDVFAPF